MKKEHAVVNKESSTMFNHGLAIIIIASIKEKPWIGTTSWETYDAIPHKIIILHDAACFGSAIK